LLRFPDDWASTATCSAGWYRELSEDEEKVFKGHGKTRDEEMVKLKRELAQVKKVRDICKKWQRSSR
jgi:hypothetical protein